MVRRRRRLLAPPRPGPERDATRRRRLLAGAAGAAFCVASGPAFAQLTADLGGIRTSAGGAAPTIVQGPRTTDITLAASRTVIPWSAFRLTADSGVVYRFQDASGIVLNKVAGPALIDGSVEALVGASRNQGNVWFATPAGLVIGPSARVNVGGFLATTGAFAEGAFLDAGRLSFDATDAGGGRIDVRSGAEVTTSGATLALVAGAVGAEAGSTMTAADATILVGAADDFTLRFAATAGGLDLVDFVVPSASAGTTSTTPLTLRGQIVGANVFLAVVNRAEVARAVISAPGLIAAQSATTDRGDVVLTSGVGIVGRQPGLTRINGVTETSVELGTVAAQRDLLGGFAAPGVLTGQQLAAGRDLGFAVASLDAVALNAGRLLAVDATRAITLRSGAASASQLTLRTGGALTVGDGAGAVTSIGRMTIDAGTVRAGQLVSGRTLAVNASGAGAAGGPAVSLGSIAADDDATITTTAGRIVLGRATFIAARPDEGAVGRNLTLTARGAEGDISFGSPAGATVSGATRVALSAGRDLSASLSGLSNTALSFSAARDASVTASGASTSPVAITAGGDLTATLTGLSGATTLTAGRDLVANLGGLNNTALTLSGARNVAVTASGVSTGPVGITAGADLRATLTGLRGATSLTAGRDIQASLPPDGGAVTFTAERDVQLTSPGLLTVAGGTARGRVTLRSGDLDLRGLLTAASLRIESLFGALSLGGAGNAAPAAPSDFVGAPEDGMRVTDAEFGRIRVSERVAFYAGAAGETARGHLTVGDLTLDPARTPSLLLAAGPANDVSIRGAVAPGVSGGVVTVGEESAESGFQPGRILISGSIGVGPTSTAGSFIDAHALSETHLNAAREIILGSPRFITLVEGLSPDAVDIARGIPAGVAPTPEETGHIFIATGVLTLSASARIVMQNTGTRTTPGGLFIDDTAPGGPPTGGPAVSVTTTGIVDLFGSVRGSDGLVSGGLGAGFTPGLVTPGGSGGGSGSGGGVPPAGGATGPTIRFNGLDVTPSPGGGRGPGSSVLTTLFDSRLQSVAQRAGGTLAGADESAVGQRPPEAPVLATAAAEDEDAIDLDAVPVATGSFELWRRKVKRRP